MKENKTVRKAGATNSSHRVGFLTIPSDLLYRQTQQILSLKYHQHSYRGPLRSSPTFAPQVFVFADASHQTPSLFPPTPALPESRNYTSS